SCDEIDWFGTDVDLDEDHNITQAHYISDSHILFATNAGRLFLTSVDPFELSHELLIEGHELKHTPPTVRWNDDVLYDADLYSDFEGFWVHGDKFVCVHRQNQWDFQNTNHTISIWSPPVFCGPSSKPDPSSPFTSEFVQQV
ncbi:MAG: hypothetical protein KDA84_27080, partial [Planctomycetaceae bacterium]|nr:hypothetical protein [Planctomycetaceae bacterium]